MIGHLYLSAVLCCPVPRSQVCTVKHKDIRKFLDGIYVSDSGTIVKDE